MSFLARVKKLTNYIYSPTNPASEDAIRGQIDDSIQEVYDNTQSALTDTSGSNLIGHSSANVAANKVGNALEEIAIVAKGLNTTLNVKSVLDYGLVGDGVANDATALNALITSIGSEKTTILFTPLMTGEATYLIQDNVSFPSNVTVMVLNGATIKPDNTYTVTGTDTELSAGLYQVFDLSLGGAVSGTWKFEESNSEWFGPVGDGSTDDNTEIQTLFNISADKKCVLESGKNFKTSAKLSAGVGTHIMAYGSKISNTTSHITLLSLAESCRLHGLEIEGNGNSSVDFNGVGIEVQGTDASTYFEKVELKDCHIHDVGSYGVYSEFADDFEVVDCFFENCGYTGVIGLSNTRMKVKSCKVKNISPGSSGNAYGIFITRQVTDDIAVYPLSKDCIVENCLVEDVPLWEGIDTHAGQNIKIVNNTVKGCKKGIAIVDDGSGTYGFHAPNDCEAIGNTIEGAATGEGIVIAGSSTEDAKNIVVSNNIIKEAGLETNNNTGAILSTYTESLIISGNSLRDCYSNAINMNGFNVGFVIKGNVIIDVQDSSNSVCAGVLMNSADNNEGVISGNALMRTNPALNTYVSERGIYRKGNTTTIVAMDNNLNQFVFPHTFMEGQNVTYGHKSDGKAYEFAGAGSPEGVITADVGATYINHAGGASTVLYVKESGSGNTGWVAK